MGDATTQADHVAEPWLTVMGAGYVGLVTAAGLAAKGHRVRLIEVDQRRLSMLRAGEVPISEPGLGPMIHDAVEDGRLVVDDRLSTEDRLIWICVGTPIGEDGQVDLRQLEAAVREARPNLAMGSAIVVRSTMPVGSAQTLRRWAHGHQQRVISNPEFLRQGTALEDFRRPNRIVIGRFADSDPQVVGEVADIVQVDGVPLLTTGIEDANIIKNGANAFLALKLSFANELAVLCEEVGGDIDVVLAGIGKDPRIGSAYLRPSFGFGGSCLPKELRTLANAGNSVGLPMLVTDAASAANHSHQRRFADRVITSVEDIHDPKVGVLGLAFKADTDDVRSSPSVSLCRWLLDNGITVTAYDPEAGENAKRAVPTLHVATAAADVASGAHALVIATEWSEFRTLDWGALRVSMDRPVVFDGRRLLDPSAMKALGFTYHAVGSSAEAV